VLYSLPYSAGVLPSNSEPPVCPVHVVTVLLLELRVIIDVWKCV